MLKAPLPHQACPFANHNINKGVSCYQAALAHAQVAHHNRCKERQSPLVDQIANKHAMMAQKLFEIAAN